MNGKFVVSKIDAARRQLETAIRLYFSHGDPVSIHTLTAAAYNVLRDVTAKTCVDPMLIKGKMLDYVKSEHKSVITAKVNEAENFFKHADRDHDTSLDFNPEMSELMIIDACVQYNRLTGEEPPLFVVYRVWLMINHPDIFILPEELKRMMGVNAPSAVGIGRAQFFAQALPLMSQIAK